MLYIGGILQGLDEQKQLYGSPLVIAAHQNALKHVLSY